MTFVKKQIKKYILFITLALFTVTGYSQENEHENISLTNASIEEEFFVEYCKMQIETQKKLTLMHKKGMLEKLGSEKVNGNISGTLSYKTKISGFSGIVTITYENYCDKEGWVFDGILITKANIKGNGKLGGTMNVTGKTNAKVIYDDVALINASPAQGDYQVIIENSEKRPVNYIWYLFAENQVK